MITALCNLIALVLAPFVTLGVLQRTKSLWSGRRGPPVLQPAYDVIRLLRKTSVYSTTTTAVFRVAPWVLLVTSIGSASLVPLLGQAPLVGFRFDFVWFAYVWGLGRVALMLAALDTGSSFEGMGAAREATFSTLLEPALFLVLGALCLDGRTTSLHEALVPHPGAGAGSLLVWGCSVATLLVVVQVECARMPVDDPSTHLELTMVHEVMVLDHSGPDLAAVQTASALKLYVGTSVIASLLDPWAGQPGPLTALAHVGLCLALAVGLGTVESLIARFKLDAIPKYIALALGSAALALIATAWRAGGAP